jgi:hypothetical protein
MLIWFGQRYIKIIANFDVDDAYLDVPLKPVVQLGCTSPISKGFTIVSNIEMLLKMHGA